MSNVSSKSKGKRRSRRRKPIPGMVPRILVMCVVIGLLGVAAYATVTKIAQPYALQGDEQTHIRSLSRQLSATESQNKDLERQVVYLNRPDGVEMTARSFGYVKHGEEGVVVETPVSLAPAPANTSLMTRIRSAFNALMGR